MLSTLKSIEPKNVCARMGGSIQTFFNVLNLNYIPVLIWQITEKKIDCFNNHTRVAFWQLSECYLF